MVSLEQDISSLYQIAKDVALPQSVRMAAAGSLASFLSSKAQPVEKWLLDTLTLRMGLCLVLTALGREAGDLTEDVRLVKTSLSHKSISRIEGVLSRLTSLEFAGGALTTVINDSSSLQNLYIQALDKAQYAPELPRYDEHALCRGLENLLV